MKIPGMSNKEIVIRIIAMPTLYVIIFVLLYWQEPRYSLRQYLSFLMIPVAIMIALYSVVVIYILTDACSFEVDETGIWRCPKLGKARYSRWDEFVYVGLMLQKRPKYNQLVLVCSQTMPYIKRSYHDAYTCDKKAFVIPFSPEARDAIKAYSPSYSERFDRLHTNPRPNP